MFPMFYDVFLLVFLIETLTRLKASLNNGMIVHLFVKNMDDFAKVNSVYKSFLTVNPPARYLKLSATVHSVSCWATVMSILWGIGFVNLSRYKILNFCCLSCDFVQFSC